MTMTLQKLVNVNTKRSKQAGFSLVELALSVSVFAFASLTIVGLLPVGLDRMQTASINTVGIQVAQTIVNDSLQTPFSDLLTTFDNQSFYFDEEGYPVEQGQPWAYQATTSLTGGSTSTKFPNGENEDPTTNSKLATIEIQIASRTQPDQKETYFSYVSDGG